MKVMIMMGGNLVGSHYDDNTFMITVSVVAFILYHIHLYLYSNLDVKKLFDTRLISAVLVKLQLASVHNYSNISRIFKFYKIMSRGFQVYDAMHWKSHEIVKGWDVFQF